MVARLRSKSLDGGWSEDSLWSAIKTRVFPRNAVTDRKAFTPERNVKWPCKPGVDSDELHNCCSTDFCCSSPVKFADAIPIYNRQQGLLINYPHAVVGSINEPSCEIILMQICLISMKMNLQAENIFTAFMNDFTRRLFLTQRQTHSEMAYSLTQYHWFHWFLLFFSSEVSQCQIDLQMASRCRYLNHMQ